MPDVRFLYVVRCNFGDAEREPAWNRWYNGPKLRDMLAKPHFACGQRFEAVAGAIGVRYLALWGLERAEALETAEYRSSWGFADWAGAIRDWTRDLCELDQPVPAAALTCPLDRRLRLATAGDADGASDRMLWARSVGLDRSAPRFGVEIVAAGHPVAAGETVFRPLIEAAAA